MALIGGIKEKEMKHCFYVRHRNGGWVNSPEVATWIVGPFYQISQNKHC
jgi:hypothetical protein